jgi:alginate O-acetyltransferase complex protein AlgI
MILTSVTFLMFFIIFFLTYLRLDSLRSRCIYLTVASYFFYSLVNTFYVLILLTYTITNYVAGIGIENNSRKLYRGSIFFFSLFADLSILIFFKYVGFLSETTDGILKYLGFDLHWGVIEIILPIGISFYTFRCIAYVIDVWRKDIKAERSFMRFAAFVTFFPQLLAGPISRASDFIPQLLKMRRPNAELFFQGLFWVTVGLFMKLVIADNLGPYVDRVYDHPFPVSAGNAWVATYAYAFQIYGDFGGYSHIAIGLSLMLGFYTPPNFNAPYAATSFSDFWGRWHISLSKWLRDYLYIEFGGNRKGVMRTCVNLIATMLLGGLWHGAGWKFLIWGGVHGCYLAAERLLDIKKRMNNLEASRLGVLFRRLVIFQFICIAWVFFRGKVSRSWELLQIMFGLRHDAAVDVLGFRVTVSILSMLGVLLVFQWLIANGKFTDITRKHKHSKVKLVLIESIMIICIIVAKGEPTAFIYFKF